MSEAKGLKITRKYPLSRFGRRRPLCVYCLIAGTTLIIAGALPKSSSKIVWCFLYRLNFISSPIKFHFFFNPASVPDWLKVGRSDFFLHIFVSCHAHHDRHDLLATHIVLQIASILAGFHSSLVYIISAFFPYLQLQCLPRSILRCHHFMFLIVSISSLLITCQNHLNFVSLTFSAISSPHISFFCL
jgi:hypothetical protein